MQNHLKNMETKRIPDTGYTFLRSNLGTADAESSHFIQTRRISQLSGAFLGAANAEISQIRHTKFLGPIEVGHGKKMRDGLLSSPTY